MSVGIRSLEKERNLVKVFKTWKNRKHQESKIWKGPLASTGILALKSVNRTETDMWNGQKKDFICHRDL